MEDLNMSEGHSRFHSEDMLERIAESLMHIQKTIRSQANKLQEINEQLKQFDSTVQKAKEFSKKSPAVSTETLSATSDLKSNSTADIHPSTGDTSESSKTHISDVNKDAHTSGDTSPNQSSILCVPYIPNINLQITSTPLDSAQIVLSSNPTHVSVPNCNNSSSPIPTVPISNRLSTPTTTFFGSYSHNHPSASLSSHSSGESPSVVFNPLKINFTSQRNSLSSTPSLPSPQFVPSQFSASTSSKYLQYSKVEFPSSDSSNVSLIHSTNKSRNSLTSNKWSVTLRIPDFPDNPERVSYTGEDLLIAAYKGQLEEVRKLLESGADINYSDQCGKTCLHMAAGNAHYYILHFLLNEGVNVNTVDKFGNSALFASAYNDHSGRCVSLLIAAQADVHRVNSNGFTPLHLAAISGNEAAVRALVRAGARKTTRDNSGRTPFDCAQEDVLREILRPISTSTHGG